MFTRFDLCRATPEEARRQLPGDEVILHPIMSQTHAITIDVPPGQVWPWLVQMGCGHAGWYSYDMKLPTPLMISLYRLAHFIMDRKHLVGIKQRAERLALEGVVA